MESTTTAPVAARRRPDYAPERVSMRTAGDRPTPGEVPPDAPEGIPPEAFPVEAEAAPAEAVAPLTAVPAETDELDPAVVRSILAGLTDGVRLLVERDREGASTGAVPVEWENEVGALRGEFLVARSETNAEFVAFRGEFATFRKDPTAEVAGLRVAFEGFRDETRAETGSLRGGVGGVREGFSVLRGEFEGLRREFDAFRVEIRTDFQNFEVKMEAKRSASGTAILSDCRDFRVEIRSDFRDFEAMFEKFTAEMKGEFRAFTAEMKGEFRAFTAEMKGEFRAFTAEMKADSERFLTRLEAQVLSVKRWVIGGIIAGVASFLVTAAFSIFGR